MLGSALLGPAWLVGCDSSALIMIDAVLDFQGLADYNDMSRTCCSLLLLSTNVCTVLLLHRAKNSDVGSFSVLVVKDCLALRSLIFCTFAPLT